MKTITDAEYEEYHLLKEARYALALFTLKAVMWSFIGAMVLLMGWALQS